MVNLDRESHVLALASTEIEGFGYSLSCQVYEHRHTCNPDQGFALSCL